MGVFPVSYTHRKERFGLPHARGGVSDPDLLVAALGESSPRPWGCFLFSRNEVFTSAVFPTPVGVFPAWEQPEQRQRRLPHARGGVSACGIVRPKKTMSSPRPWGCFRWRDVSVEMNLVFPTPVGVFLVICYYYP